MTREPLDNEAVQAQQGCIRLLTKRPRQNIFPRASPLLQIGIISRALTDTPTTSAQGHYTIWMCELR
ncbi:MAG TPA: hypothetical protein VGE93_02530 [Bryobacteraceae bacterium]